MWTRANPTLSLFSSVFTHDFMLDLNNLPACTAFCICIKPFMIQCNECTAASASAVSCPHYVEKLREIMEGLNVEVTLVTPELVQNHSEFMMEVEKVGLTKIRSETSLVEIHHSR